MYFRHQYGVWQHVDAINSVWCADVQRNVQGSKVIRVEGGLAGSSDVCRDELFACCCECIGGVNMVYCNTLMQWHVVS